MNPWASFPSDYRQQEVRTILQSVRAGESVFLAGLSGAGKSNLLGFLALRVAEMVSSPGDLREPLPLLALIDCNRLTEYTGPAFFRLVRQSLEAAPPAGTPAPTPPLEDEWAAVASALHRRLQEHEGVCLLIDRLDAFSHHASPETVTALHGNLRALRDTFKYRLTYVAAARRPLAEDGELGELFLGHTLWLGPLSESDARWNIERIAARLTGSSTLDPDRPALDWQAAVVPLLEITWGYPSFLRSACEAFASGTPLEPSSVAAYPAVRRRLAEFWADAPTPAELRQSRLSGNVLLELSQASRPPSVASDSTPPELTAKELLLLNYFQAHPGQVCSKDELVRAVWSEDKVFLEGVRDDNLAQLVRRLRKKIEPNPASPQHIQTLPGRGYRYHP